MYLNSQQRAWEKQDREKAQHTPGPWEARGCSIGNPAKPLKEWHIGRFDSPSDAQYAVHACNCHDDLLAALEELAQAVLWQKGKHSDELLAAYTNARNAIAKAKGQAGE